MEAKQSAWAQIRGLPANYWYVNIMEMFERLAFFGVRAIAPLYLIASSGENGLGLDYGQKGLIYTVWALLQCLIPMVSGGYTDRYGYRKSLAVAFTINILGYIGMAQSKPISDALAAQGWEGANFWVFMLAACLVATGTAIFKPPIQGTVAKATTEATSSVGWGVFYWVVNIGGALAPMGAALLRAEIDWHLVFYAAAIVTFINFLPAFLLYKEPERTPPASGEADTRGPLGVFASSIMNIFKDLRLVVFLLIFSCFWLMFMQLFDLLPNFVDEWVDTSDVAGFFGWFSGGWLTAEGQTKPEIIINIDAIAIIILVIPISWLISRINKVAAMIIGMVISLFGFLGAGATAIGLVCCIMIFVFAIGEMACSPTFSAYIGLIAPKDKKALYMGYSNIPFAIGWALGSLVGGYFYEDYGAKAGLALKHLAAKTELVARAAQAADWSDCLEKIPPLLEIERGAAFAEARKELGLDAAATAQSLRDSFVNDQGQIENLALLYLAVDPENRERTVTGFVNLVKEGADQLADHAQEFVEQVKSKVKPQQTPGEQKPGDSQPATQESAEDDLPAADAIISDADRIKKLVARVRRLVRDDATLADVVHLLPKIVGKKRDAVLDAVRDLVNKNRPQDQWLDHCEIVALLWERFGDNPQVLNNLALEYLAQATNQVHDAAAPVTLKYPTDKLEQRTAALQKQLGIGRGKAFAALSAAVGSDDAELDKRLAELDVATDSLRDRVFIYLAGQRKHRDTVIAKKNWVRDRKLLRELIRSDPKALEIVLAEIDQESWSDRLGRAVRGLFVSDEGAGQVSEEGVDYHKLAGNKDLIKKALKAKDWSQAPDQAARLLRLNPFEARALARADTKQASQTLWDLYHPFMVWIYLGAIGLVGTIGMIIFYYTTKRPAPVPDVG